METFGRVPPLGKNYAISIDNGLYVDEHQEAGFTYVEKHATRYYDIHEAHEAIERFKAKKENAAKTCRVCLVEA